MQSTHTVTQKAKYLKVFQPFCRWALLPVAAVMATVEHIAGHVGIQVVCVVWPARRLGDGARQDGAWVVCREIRVCEPQTQAG